MQSALSYFSSLVVTAPVILAWLAGIGITLSRWEQLPNRVAKYALGGFVLNLLANLAGGLVSILPIMLYDGNIATSQIGLMMAGASFIVSIMHAIGLVLLLVALFSRRVPPEQAV